MKTCTKCGLPKDTADFDRVRKGDERRKSQCKDCIRTAKGHKPHPHSEVMAANRLLLSDGQKICVRCREQKPITAFYRSRANVGMGQLNPVCKVCVTRQDRMRKYGMTLDQVLAAELITHCPGCLRELDQPGTKRCFDHCHSSGAFRRVLCETCNIAVGMVFNSPETLRRLATLIS